MSATFNPNNVLLTDVKSGNVPVEQGKAILKEVMSNSLIMQLAQYEPMTKQKKEFDVFLGGLGAYWVGEGEKIQTTQATWAKATMEAKKLGVIIPVSREYLTYKQADFFEFIKPMLAEALYRKFDQAVITGEDNPFEWSIKKSASGDRKITGALSLTNYDKLVSALNDEGFEPNAFVSKVSNNTKLKGLVRDENGIKTSVYDSRAKALDGVPAFNVDKEIAEFKKGSLYAGDFNYARYGIPYNMTYAISEDATLSTIKGEDGQPINLFERELVALRVTMDVAFMIVKDEAFATLDATAESSTGR